MKINILFGLIVSVAYALGLFMSDMLDKPASKLYVNQELRQEAFLACVKSLPANASTPSINACSSEAERLATTGDDSGKILYRPKQGDVK